MGSTKIELITDLENELLTRRDLTDKQVTKIHKIISSAKDGYFHSSESPVATPKTYLKKVLEQAGLPKLVKKVLYGDYDE